jgi:hypothetical protein
MFIGSITSMLFGALVYGASTASAQTKFCADGVNVISRNCPTGSPPGIFYMWNNDGAVHHFQPGSALLSVGLRQKLAVQICNYGNIDVWDHTIPLGSTLLPTVVGNVGESGLVKVQVLGSANVNVNGQLVVGMKIAEGQVTGDLPDASLMSEIVKGSLGKWAEISVLVQNSANVKLASSSTQLWIGKGSLMQEVVNVEPRQVVQNVCLAVEVSQSANVYATNGGAKVYIRDGQLDDETLDLPSFYNNATVNDGLGRTEYSILLVNKNNVANIENVSELHIWDGELSDETIDAGDIVRCTANITLFEVGNARVSGYTRIVDGELVDEMLDVTFLRDYSTVNVVANGVGNVWAHTLEIIEGDLVDEMVDVEMEVNTGSVIRVDVNNIANARTASHLIISNSELIDEVIDVGTAITQSTAVVNMRNSGNSYCSANPMHTIVVTNGEQVVDLTYGLMAIITIEEWRVLILQNDDEWIN